MYHYIRDLKNSRYPNIKGLDINLFKDQIIFLMKNYSIITMEEVIYSIENGVKIPDKSALLTFDDAYSDHYNNVFPILDRYNIQGSFYIPSKAVSEHVVLDVNKIHFILVSAHNTEKIIDDLKVLIKSYKKRYDLNNFEYYYNKLAIKSPYDTAEVIFIKRLLQVELVEELRSIMVNYLFEKYVSIDERAFSMELYMNEEQLRHMLRSGMHIGNHGYNHYWWNNLCQKEMKHEIDLSNKFLEKIGVDMRQWTACYPYGSYDDQSIDILKEKGCKLALTTEHGIASIDKNTRFTMPRIDTNELLSKF
jgi:peptidoglycan/xylan/chitin deacetylase (PgdA/CDA1 family)